ncbi:hypothetical protein ABZ904_32960 [Streptomyces sp. NPDC046900]|uniref:hypothetical protein n=1 Tax=Streptomyces sp. NPDC046900 TaxID=3155473 RepID=UPI0033C51CE5
MPYLRHVLRLSVAALALLGLAPGASADGWWSVAPATGGAGGRPYVYAEGEPGSVLQDAVSVLNPGRGPLTVRLSGADAGDTTQAGSTAPRTRPVEAGAWLRFARTTGGRRVAAHTVSVTVPARTRADVPFSVTVPTDAAPGDRAAAILASADGRTSAVRLRLRVRGPALSAVTVEHVRVHGGRIAYELVNRGTTVLAPRLAVHADGVLGPVLDRAPRALPLELPPGHRVRLTEPWPHHPVFDSVKVRLTVTAAGAAPGSASASAWFVPWGALAGTAAGLLAALGAGVVVRHRGRRPADRETDDRTRTDAELTGAVT